MSSSLPLNPMTGASATISAPSASSLPPRSITNGSSTIPPTTATPIPPTSIPAPKPGFTKVPAFIPAPTFSSTSAPETAPKVGPPAPKPPTDDQILDSLARESKEWDKDSEIARILSTFALDSYSVLDLQPGVPESQIIATYRKKSLLIHPDKTSNPSAPAAFDKLKKAQTELLDEKARTRLDEAISDARMLVMRERGLSKDSEEMRPEVMSEELKVAWREMTKRVLVENELRRRKQLKVQMAEEGRELKKQEEEIAERKRKRDDEVKWEQGRDGRINSWRNFAEKKTGGGAETKKKKKEKMKVLG